MHNFREEKINVHLINKSQNNSISIEIMLSIQNTKGFQNVRRFILNKLDKLCLQLSYGKSNNKFFTGCKHVSQIR